MIYRPTRERDLEMLKEYAYAMLKSTGHEEISLSSLSSSDYSDLAGIVNFLIDEFEKTGVNISPSVLANRCVLTGRYEQSSGHQKQPNVCTGSRFSETA